MTQPADQPLLAEPDGLEPAPPAKRRRTTAAKARPAIPAAEPAPAAKPKAKRVVKKKTVLPEPDLPGLQEPAPAAQAKPAAAPEKKPPAAKTPVKRRRPAKAETTEPPAPVPAPAPAAPVSRSPVEEWSPSRPAPAREPAPAPEPVPASERPEPAPAPEEPLRTPEQPAESGAPAAPARKYPVYIPRHVARQMEEQGQTAPLAVPADAIPEAARAAVEAAQAAQAARAQNAPSRPEQAPPSQGNHPQGQHQQPHHHPREHDRDRDRGRGRDRRDRGREQEREPRDPDQDRERDYVTSEPSPDEVLVPGEGMVEISGKGFGFIRDPKRSFAQHPQDIFVTPELVRKYNLRDGQWIKGETRRGGRGAQLCRITEINGGDPEGNRILPAFDELTVVSPMERITLETVPDRYTTRIIDLFAPIGKGQRGIIVAPPRTGKTTLLQHIADAVVKLHPDIVLIILLVDERPEEVTDIKRTVPGAEVMASSNDMDVKSHTRIAQLAIERAKRLVESGKDVFVLLDSITRVGRAFNNAMANGGRTMSGGVDSRALEIPRRLFAAARNTEEAGSLTIVATALIETGSKADELIFQEFKGTGNMELVLDRKISDQRIYPAVDIFQSGTRREELLIPADDLHKIALIRRGLAGHKPMEAIERLLFFLRKFPSNAQMLREIPANMNPDRPSPISRPAREVDVEVLPKGQSGPGANDPLAALIARLMDSLFTVPGTKIKVGLDPVIGLLPFVGAPASALVSVVMLVRSAQAGVPPAVLARMALNVILNSVLDEVPVVGDFISIFFRSNKMNYELLQKHAGTRRAYTARDKALVIGIVGGAIVFVLCALIGLFYLVSTAFHWVFRH